MALLGSRTLKLSQGGVGGFQKSSVALSQNGHAGLLRKGFAFVHNCTLPYLPNTCSVEMLIPHQDVPTNISLMIM